LSSRWQYQLQGVTTHASTGGINTSLCVVPKSGGACVRPNVYDIDLYEDASVSGNNDTVNVLAVQAIHAQGGHAVCYVDAGTWENWRPDQQEFVDFNSSCGNCLLGNNNGFPGERWFNVNNDKGQRTFLLEKMAARVGLCVTGGYDGVEFDNVDGYQNSTGFSISANTQLLYNTGLANLAHAHGLSVAIKNDVGQVNDLEPYFDYAVNEQCFQYSECNFPAPGLKGFPPLGKAVFNVEYKSRVWNANCGKADLWNFSSISKTVDLFDTPWIACR
jgi:hypothetical protein